MKTPVLLALFLVTGTVHAQVAENAPYEAVEREVLMIYQVPVFRAFANIFFHATPIERGTAAQIVGVSRRGRFLFLLDEFNRGGSSGLTVPFITADGAESYRLAILQGSSINLAACVRQAELVGIGLGLPDRAARRNAAFIYRGNVACNFGDRTPLLEAYLPDYDRIPLDEVRYYNELAN